MNLSYATSTLKVAVSRSMLTIPSYYWSKIIVLTALKSAPSPCAYQIFDSRANPSFKVGKQIFVYFDCLSVGVILCAPRIITEYNPRYICNSLINILGRSVLVIVLAFSVICETISDKLRILLKIPYWVRTNRYPFNIQFLGVLSIRRVGQKYRSPTQ